MGRICAPDDSRCIFQMRNSIVMVWIKGEIEVVQCPLTDS
jgi:hypothetical protein